MKKNKNLAEMTLNEVLADTTKQLQAIDRPSKHHVLQILNSYLPVEELERMHVCAAFEYSNVYGEYNICLTVTLLQGHPLYSPMLAYEYCHANAIDGYIMVKRKRVQPEETWRRATLQVDRVVFTEKEYAEEFCDKTLLDEVHYAVRYLGTKQKMFRETAQVVLDAIQDLGAERFYAVFRASDLLKREGPRAKEYVNWFHEETLREFLGQNNDC